MLQSILFLSFTFWALTGCDTKDRTPVPGKRHDFIQTLTAQSTRSQLNTQPIHVNQAITNEAWPQNSLLASHATPNLRIANEPKQLYRVAVGSGSYDEHQQMANVAIDDKHAYVLDTQGQVFAVNKNNGEHVWSVAAIHEDDQSSEMLGGGICVNADKVIVTTSFGRVFAFDAATGKTIWHVNVGAPIRASATPHESRLFVVTINNTCLALNDQDGTILWEHQGIVETTALLGTASPAAYGDTVIAAYSSGEVFALQANNGQVLWGEVLVSGMRSDTLSAFPHIRARPIIDHGTVTCINYGGTMASFDLKTGQRQWNTPLSGLHTPAICQNVVFALTHDNVLKAIDRNNGHIRWSEALPNVDNGDAIHYAGPLLVNGTLALTSSKGNIIFVSVQDGQKVKELAIGSACYLSPVVSNNRFYVLERDGYLSVWG